VDGFVRIDRIPLVDRRGISVRMERVTRWPLIGEDAGRHALYYPVASDPLNKVSYHGESDYLLICTSAVGRRWRFGRIVGLLEDSSMRGLGGGTNRAAVSIVPAGEHPTQ
jgi:hypothetical protein